MPGAMPENPAEKMLETMTDPSRMRVRTPRCTYQQSIRSPPSSLFPENSLAVAWLSPEAFIQLPGGHQFPGGEAGRLTGLGGRFRTGSDQARAGRTDSTFGAWERLAATSAPTNSSSARGPASPNLGVASLRIRV